MLKTIVASRFSFPLIIINRAISPSLAGLGYTPQEMSGSFILDAALIEGLRESCDTKRAVKVPAWTPDPLCTCVCAYCIVSDSLEPSRFLFPWDSPGKNTGVGCHFLLQGIFLTQASNHVSCLAGRCFTTEPPGKLPVWRQGL